ncbi:MAG: aminotransferase class III-fold pyridoxal phosphate-dependent enzyme [Candidatus Latescibacteria bacterium]|jgi:glutamate-1-semialdehyde 2,1-aminomutase|nr:aminotransferase class III-fold pyridoxal phosphate-dependent enzyme [Candidatus Latescibacterota bacterium]
MDDTNAGRLLELADRCLAGGALGMFRMPEEVATVFERGEGSRIFDVDGREYIDYVIGSGPLILGHAHPAVVAAVQEQVGKGTTFYGLNEPAIRLAERVAKAVPCGEQVRFTASGTEATFYALRLARSFTEREKVLKFEGGWHGGHDYAQQSAAPSRLADYPAPVPDSSGIPGGAAQTVLVTPFNDTEAAVQVIEAHGRDLAAVIVEPLQRAVPPEPGFLDALRNATRSHGVVLVFDEIVTGFRLAWGGAQERYGVVPDLAVYGKTISGGHPLAAICGRSDIMVHSDSRRKGREPYVFISGTMSGNPVSTAAGIATLDELKKDGVYSRLGELSERLRTGLEALGRELGLPLRVMGDGPVLQPFFTEGEIRNHADVLQADAGTATAFGVELIRRGIFVNPNGKLYLSLALSDDDIDTTLAAARGALERAGLKGANP